MKNINYVINGILAVAVIVLFVLQFTGESKTISVPEHASSDTTMVAGNGSIAYFRIDSVLANWDLYLEAQKDLASKQQELETDFESKSQSFVKRVEDAQDGAQPVELLEAEFTEKDPLPAD